MLVFLIATALADPGFVPALGGTAHLSFSASEAPLVGEWRVAAVSGLSACATPVSPCTGVPVALGAELIIVQVGEDPEAERPFRWVQVAAAGPGESVDHRQALGAALGWVPTTALTGAAWRADPDQDGEQELVLVRYEDSKSISVVVIEPGVPADKGVSVVDLGIRSDIDGPQTDATVDLTPASLAGIPLVRVNWTAQEMCGSGDSTAYASYRSTGAGKGGALRAALSHSGSGGDAPIWWATEVRFSPKSKTVTIVSSSGESNNDGTDTLNGDVVEHYVLKKGVFVKSEPKPGAKKPTGL